MQKRDSGECGVAAVIDTDMFRRAYEALIRRKPNNAAIHPVSRIGKSGRRWPVQFCICALTMPRLLTGHALAVMAGVSDLVQRNPIT